ncbi:hypothetical protein NSA31_03200 [Bacillus subtilis]|uniref:hypothetical protein n=1 Tax=Bacillus subtilis TaxID=1423 RepID=UPI00214A5BBE|nr:hypothetical protein [Bacillus subtilis]MCR1990819.1 hypothetical protein [Bacillus subtilis]
MSSAIEDEIVRDFIRPKMVEIIYSDNENEKYEQFVKQVSGMVVDYIDKNQKMKGEKN